jgi:hypothetical protein
MSANPDRLYELLPVIHRERDAAEGYPLRALLRLITEQADLLQRDIRTFHDDLFIETCRSWVVPYIGDLVGNRLLFDASRLTALDATARELFPDLTGPDLRPTVALRTRADVAKTIYYRRRKGTLAMLEELARDVTGWPAHAVEFFELLGWSQHREHLRFQSRWMDVRSVDRMERVNGPFDETSHTVDVRRIAQQEGWHNIPNVGFFLYRLGSYELKNVPARVASAPWRYHFSPLGNPAPLFTRWRREGDESGLATELHVPAPIRHAFFHEDLLRYRNLPAPPARPDYTDLYGLPDPIAGDPTAVSPEASFFVRVNGASVAPTQNPTAPPGVFQPQVVCRQLEPWPAARPNGRILAVDVQMGRIALGDGFGNVRGVDVYYHYGFGSDLGGGTYERPKWLLAAGVAEVQLFVQEGVAPGAIPNTYPSLTDALTAWATTFARPDAVVTILDSRTYALPASLQLKNEGFLVIEAANGQRPLLQTAAAGLDIGVLPPAVAGDPDRGGALTLSGVVVEGHLHVTGDLGRLRLLHATLVPGRALREDGQPQTSLPSIVVDAGPANAPLNAQLRLEAAFSILGSIECPEHAQGVWLLDSIVDALSDTGTVLAAATGTGPSLAAERATLFGRLDVRELELSESIVTGLVQTARTQEGCVRFSWTPHQSHTPRRYRCQPDLAVEAAIQEALRRNPALPDADKVEITNFVQGYLKPAFRAVDHGRPEYAQLRLSAPLEIRTGAEDGSEMGVFSHVKQPQREGNLQVRLDEYLPFGLQAGIIYVT